jgi:CO/xanthine dehydrogenase Mo-binding subunit
MGEAGTSAIVAAVANAVFAATRKRFAQAAARCRRIEAAGLNGA